MEIRKFAINYGTVLGLFLVLVASAFWMLGVDEQESVLPSIINNLSIIGFLFYSKMYHTTNVIIT